jgi:hypothetical protein
LDWLGHGREGVAPYFRRQSFQIIQDKPLPGGHGWQKFGTDGIRRIIYGWRRSAMTRAMFESVVLSVLSWTVRFVARLGTGDYLVAAFVVSGVALLAAALVRAGSSNSIFLRKSLNARWFSSDFPTAYFLHIGYPKASSRADAQLDLCRALRTMVAGGILGGLAWMTRANGIVLLPTLAVEAALQYGSNKRWQWQWLWIAVIPAGFGVYLLLNFHVTGDPFAFLHMRQDMTSNSFAWPWVGMREAVGSLHRHPNQAEMVGVQELFFVALGFVCAVESWFKLRPTFAMWLTGSWILLNCVRFIQVSPVMI